MARYNRFPPAKSSLRPAAIDRSNTAAAGKHVAGDNSGNNCLKNG